MAQLKTQYTLTYSCPERKKLKIQWCQSYIKTWFNSKQIMFTRNWQRKILVRDWLLSIDSHRKKKLEKLTQMVESLRRAKKGRERRISIGLRVFEIWDLTWRTSLPLTKRPKGYSKQWKKNQRTTGSLLLQLQENIFVFFFKNNMLKPQLTP